MSEIKSTENVVTAECTVKEESVNTETKLDKAKAWGKKHWKGIAVGAAVAAGGVLLAVLGYKKKKSEVNDSYDGGDDDATFDDDNDVIDADLD